MNRLRRTQGSDPAITYDYGLVFDKPFTVHGNNGDVDNRDWFWLSLYTKKTDEKNQCRSGHGEN